MTTEPEKPQGIEDQLKEIRKRLNIVERSVDLINDYLVSSDSAAPKSKVKWRDVLKKILSVRRLLSKGASRLTVDDLPERRTTGFPGFDLLIVESMNAELEKRPPDYSRVLVAYLTQHNFDDAEWGGLMFLAEGIIRQRSKKAAL